MPFLPASTRREPAFVRAFRQIGYLKDAWETAQRKYAAEAIIRHTSEEFYGLVAGFIPGLLSQFFPCLIAISTGAGVGGAVGAFLSGGPGAIPGAVVGAKVGLLVSTWYLSALGLRFLMEFVRDGLEYFGKLLLDAIAIAWHSEGREDRIDLAARRMADAVGVLFAMILQAMVSYLLSKGRGAAKERFAKSALGRQVYAWVDTQAQLHHVVCDVLRKPRAPASVRRRVARALQFFEANRRQLPDRYGGKLSDATRDEYLRAIDFSRPIDVVTLRPGTRLISYMNPRHPFGKFAAQSGVYHDRLGLDPAGRQLVVYVVKKKVRVLRTRTTGIAIPTAKARLEAWKTSRAGNPGALPPALLQAEGGGGQYVIPDSRQCLTVVYQHFPGKPERQRATPNRRGSRTRRRSRSGADDAGDRS
jgi:hypothetical protein